MKKYLACDSLQSRKREIFAQILQDRKLANVMKHTSKQQWSQRKQ